MKKGFMNKKTADMTGWEAIKWTGMLTVIMYGAIIAVCWIIYKLDDMIDFFKSIGSAIKSKFSHEYNWVDDDLEDEEEENGLY